MSRRQSSSKPGESADLKQSTLTSFTRSRKSLGAGEEVAKLRTSKRLAIAKLERPLVDRISSISPPTKVPIKRSVAKKLEESPPASKISDILSKDQPKSVKSFKKDLDLNQPVILKTPSRSSLPKSTKTSAETEKDKILTEESLSSAALKNSECETSFKTSSVKDESLKSPKATKEDFVKESKIEDSNVFIENVAAVDESAPTITKIAAISTPENVLPTAAISIPAIPAYRRFAPLLSPRLELPQKFVYLEKLLYALDSVCNLILDRDQIPVFHRIQKSIENITERNVTVDHLKQLKTLLPDAYAFIPTVVLFNGRKKSSFMVEFGGRKGSLPQVELESRREILHQKLFIIAMDHHETFLREQNISLPPNAILKSWHPKYSQDSVPDIVCTDLFDSSHTPEQPKKVRPSIEKEMNDLASPSQPKPTSLLERIKEKQRKAELDLMLGRREAELKGASATVLAEFCDTLAFLFGSLNKTSIILNELVTKVAQNSKMGMSAEEVVRNIERIQSVAPGWITIGSSGGHRIVRIDRSKSIKHVKEEIISKR